MLWTQLTLLQEQPSRTPWNAVKWTLLQGKTCMTPLNAVKSILQGQPVGLPKNAVNSAQEQTVGLPEMLWTEPRCKE